MENVSRRNPCAAVASLDATVAVFRRWLHLPDPAALYAVLGAVAANRLPGDPVWLLLVGSPGSGKSELLQALGSLHDVHPTATLTEAALLSGTPKKERDGAASGGLLRTMGDFGILLAKDFGSVLSMPREARAATLAALREVYDGQWTRHLGTDGGKTLHWDGKVGLIAGCTPTIDRHHAVMGAMGERFILFRLPAAEAHEQAARALAHAEAEPQMRAELSAAVTTLFARQATEPPKRDDDDNRRLVNLATLVVRCRSAVERDGYSREIELIPEAEAPTRLVIVLARLLSGLRVIGTNPTDTWRVITAAALDSIPAVRRDAMDRLLAAGGELSTTQIAEEIGYPRSTTERALEELGAHGVVVASRAGKGRAALWMLAGWAAKSYSEASYPEMSEGACSSSSKKLTDISGQLAPAAADGVADSMDDAVNARPHGAVR